MGKIDNNRSTHLHSTAAKPASEPSSPAAGLQHLPRRITCPAAAAAGSPPRQPGGLRVGGTRQGSRRQTYSSIFGACFFRRSANLFTSRLSDPVLKVNLYCASESFLKHQSNTRLHSRFPDSSSKDQNKLKRVCSLIVRVICRVFGRQVCMQCVDSRDRNSSRTTCTQRVLARADRKAVAGCL